VRVRAVGGKPMSLLNLLAIATAPEDTVALA